MVPRKKKDKNKHTPSAYPPHIHARRMDHGHHGTSLRQLAVEDPEKNPPKRDVLVYSGYNRKIRCAQAQPRKGEHTMLLGDATWELGDLIGPDIVGLRRPKTWVQGRKMQKQWCAHKWERPLVGITCSLRQCKTCCQLGLS